MKFIIGPVLIILIFSLFIISCFITATDGQGGVVFIVTFPLMILLTFINLKLGKKFNSRRLIFLSKVIFVFFAIFFSSLFISPLQFVPAFFIGSVSFSFEKITGKSPYKWVRERNDMVAALDKKIIGNQEKWIDLSDINLRYDWERVCFFGPYTKFSEIKSTLGFDWDPAMYTTINESDSINTLVFFEGKSISYVVNYPRNKADFISLSRQCFDRKMAKFKRVLDKSDRITFEVVP